MKLLYTVFLYLIQPLILLRLLFLSYKNSSYRNRLAERYGFCKNKVKPGGILLHSVSVGETLTVAPLVHILRSFYPPKSLPIVITTMTPTGSECVISTFGKAVHHVYLPYDLPCAMNRFLKVLRPKLVIIMETELWPNMISMLYQRKIPLIIANARLSAISAKKYNKLRKFVCRFLNKITLIAAQNEEDATRFISLGFKREQLAVIGNLKFDSLAKKETSIHAISMRHRWLPHRYVWIAVSTHRGEENIVLEAHKKLLKIFPDLLLILVPRHQERFKNVYRITKKANFSFSLFSKGEKPTKNTQVMIGDTIGDVTLLCGLADLAFVGGSLVKKGGHNPLEPAVHSIPILMGPYTFNFKDICAKLRKVDGLITVTDANSMAKEVSNLILNENLRLQYGKHANEVLHQNQGALSLLLDFLRPYLPLLRKH